MRNKFCIICARSENKGEQAKPHVCFKNWHGSSSAMESDIIVEGFSSSEEHYGIRYKYFIADGDSSVYVNIQKKVPYGKNVIIAYTHNNIIHINIHDYISIGI